MHSYKKMSGRNKRRLALRGFTLIELLLVVAILSILAAVVLPKFTGRSEQARIAAAKTDIGNFGTALDAFEVDCGRFPTSDEGLNALVQQPSNVQNWKGYLNKGVQKDPWGHDYVYRCPGQHNTTGYDLYSFGPDGQDGGGSGDDIANWTPQQ